MPRARILIATDSDADQETILTALAAFSLRESAVVARDAEDAMAFLGDAQQAVPALVMLDTLLLPVLSSIRKDARLKRTPVIVLSSGPGKGDAGQAYDAGANSFIRRPSSTAHFNEALYQVIRYWLYLNQPG